MPTKISPKTENLQTLKTFLSMLPSSILHSVKYNAKKNTYTYISYIFKQSAGPVYRVSRLTTLQNNISTFLHQLRRTGSIPNMKLASQPSKIGNSDKSYTGSKLIWDHLAFNIIKRRQQYSAYTVCLEEAGFLPRLFTESSAAMTCLSFVTDHNNVATYSWCTWWQLN